MKLRALGIVVVLSLAGCTGASSLPGTAPGGSSSGGASSSGAPSSSGSSSSGGSSSGGGSSSSGGSSSGGSASSSGSSSGSSGSSSSGTSSSSGGPGATISINAGGDEAGAFLADAFYSGGSTYSTTIPVDTSLLGADAPPAAAFQTERYGEFSYTIPNRTPGTRQTVTLYFAETYLSAAGKRTFDVAIGEAAVLTAFDIFAAAGGANRAVARTFDTVADASGRIVIAFKRTGADNPKVCAVTVAGPGTVPPSPVVTSPNGRVRAELSTAGGVLRYRISVDGKQVLAPSELGLRSDGVEIGQDAVLGAFTIAPVDEQYPLLGARAVAVNRANTASIPATSKGEPYTVDVHVADDGVGIRLRLPARTGRRIEAERSAWRLPGDPTVWASELEPAYEQHQRTRTLGTLGTASYGMPLTAKVGDLYVSLTEAGVKDYGDLGLTAGAGGVLRGTLYADPAGWTTDAAVAQPWRVTIVAGDLTALAGATLVQSLNPPRDASLDGADWIRPGRSTWQWMAVGAPQLADQRQWVDWTQQLGFEYYLVDDGWRAWPGPWQSLQSVVAYGASKGVKVWLWVHSNEVTDAAAREAYFKQASDVGVVGVKIDFPPACSRAVATWYWDAARDAARHKLLLDFHGAAKPTGMERTWPNVLTREGVRGHEYHMTRYGRVLEPAHDTILPFTRFVAGVGDYTPTVFAAPELQGNTWAHELAQAIVFVSPFLCFAGHPRDYLANGAVDVLKAIPATWDESIVLPGSEPGRIAGFARRSGASWFVGVVNGPDAATLELPLSFLGSGTWRAVRLGDATGRADAWDRVEGTVSASDTLTVKLSSRGGFVAWFRP